MLHLSGWTCIIYWTVVRFRRLLSVALESNGYILIRIPRNPLGIAITDL
jgi:hypothetical protein